jgi:heparan-sulfate lyase
MNEKLKTITSTLCMAAVMLTVAGCTGGETYNPYSAPGSEGPGAVWVDPDGTDVEEDVKALFPLLNLDRPGLERVKELYEREEYYPAAQALLEYYRTRTGVVHTDISLVGVVATPADVKWANYSLENRFESTATLDPPHTYPLADGKINWYPAGVTEYEERWQVHRHKWMTAQAKLYRETGDEKWMTAWKTQYADWLSQNEPGIDPSRDEWSWRGLEVGHRIVEQTKLFLYFIPSQNFTPKWLCTFLANFHSHVEHISGNYTGVGNHLITQAQAEAYAGILFPEFRKAEVWMQNGMSALNNQIMEQTLEDGFHYEVDLSYHIGAIADFYLTMNLATANGKADRFPATFTERMRRMTGVVLNLTYPDYTAPNMNDTRTSSLTRSVLRRNFREYFRIFPDNLEMQWMAEEGKMGTAPGNLTAAFPTSGYYVLRNGWSGASTMMVLQNGPRAGWHSQPDNGTFEVWVRGRNFFTDSGVYKYSGTGVINAEREWFRSTRVHNTMTLDFADIPDTDENRNGKLLKMETLGGGTELLVVENPSYAGLAHRRAVFFVDREFFVIVDEGAGDAAGNVNVNFNMLGVKDVKTGETPGAVLDDASFGAHTVFADGNNMAVRSFGAAPLTFAPFAGRVSETYNQYTERNGCWSVSIAKAAADPAARFITVIYPVTGNDAADVDISASFADGGYSPSGASVEVIIDGAVYDLSYTL